MKKFNPFDNIEPKTDGNITIKKKRGESGDGFKYSVELNINYFLNK